MFKTLPVTLKYGISLLLKNFLPKLSVLLRYYSGSFLSFVVKYSTSFCYLFLFFHLVSSSSAKNRSSSVFPTSLKSEFSLGNVSLASLSSRTNSLLSSYFLPMFKAELFAFWSMVKADKEDKHIARESRNRKTWFILRNKFDNSKSQGIFDQS